jgi:putative ABC transport system permease protein
MYKTYLKQARQLIKQNRFYTVVYIAGTGLAIALVMVIAIVYHIKTADIAPETHRSRILLTERFTAKSKEGKGTILHPGKKQK